MILKWLNNSNGLVQTCVLPLVDSELDLLPARIFAPWFVAEKWLFSWLEEWKKGDWKLESLFENVKEKIGSVPTCLSMWVSTLLRWTEEKRQPSHPHRNGRSPEKNNKHNRWSSKLICKQLIIKFLNINKFNWPKSWIYKQENYPFTNTQSPGSVHPLPRNTTPSHGHITFLIIQNDAEIYQNLKTSTIRRENWFWNGSLSIDCLISAINKINSEVWIDWLIERLGAFCLIDWLIDWCTALAPVLRII